jgi:hypothetical protein
LWKVVEGKIMMGHWFGISYWWILLGALLLIGLVFLIVYIFSPSKQRNNTRRDHIIGLLEFERAAGKVDSEEFELRKTIILAEEDEHFEDTNIYRDLEKYARMEIDALQYFENINQQAKFLN